MAAFAPVAPARILEQFHMAGILGEYHLLLAHDIVANELNRATYHNVFAQRPWEGTVILDNSIIELGSAVDLDVISTAAEACRANVIVLPDVLEDADATVKSITEAFDEWRTKFDEVLGSRSYRFMIVPQGKTIEEFTTCAALLADFMDEAEMVVMWGIPRNLVKLHGTRVHGIAAVQEIDSTLDIHLLGFSDNVGDDIACAKLNGVGGIDSAVPLRVPSFEAIVNGEIAEPRGDWWDRARFTPNMLDNLVYAREVFGQ
jgi:hypothetical protein